MRGANWSKQPNDGNHNYNHKHKLNSEKVNRYNKIVYPFWSKMTYSGGESISPFNYNQRVIVYKRSQSIYKN
jgi:hypothetical protein